MAEPSKSAGTAAVPEAGPRSRQREQTRRAILDCALEVFAERGFDGATTREIAGRADVNHAMINYYFQSKDQLWRDAVALLFDRLTAHIGITHAPLAPGQSLRAAAMDFFRRYIRYCAQHPEYPRIVVQESAKAGERLEWAAKRHIAGHRDDVMRICTLLQRENILPPASTMAIYYILVGACQMIYALAPEARLLWDRDPLAEDAVDEHIDAFLTLIFREGTADGPAV